MNWTKRLVAAGAVLVAAGAVGGLWAEGGTSTVRGESHFVTFAGGPAPESDQASLEQNVLYFRRTVEALGLGKVGHEEYFADAGQSRHAVEVHVVRTPAEQISDDMAAVLNPDTERDVQFRPAAIPGLKGPATADALARWFDTTGKALPAHAHLLFYFTGHGGTVDVAPAGGGRGGGMAGMGARGRARRAAPVQDPRNTTMLLWHSPDVTVKDFEKQLDKLDPTVDVTLLMVECHSGGFANTLYTDADPKNGLAKQVRCGFFASTADRLAAGCTADIDREDYEEFSTGFFAALSGITRDGKHIQKPDYDHDGVTSLADAFAYVVITSNTIDTPMTTGDQFLRDNSRIPDTGEGELLGRNPSYADLLAASDAFHKAMLEGLSQTLQLSGDNRVIQARALVERFNNERVTLERQAGPLQRQLDQVRGRLRDQVTERWPELGIPLHPDTEKILTEEGPAIQKFLEGRPAWQIYTDLSKQLDDLDAKDDELERQGVKAFRFVYQAESAILAHNLEAGGDETAKAFYADLLARENRPLGG
ncbi:MAG TPA: hypothetical protein VH253_02355 [Phycisphaerae bacterium]|nr:hypothetical protein [Phycisphaerae bacterium]